MSLPTDADSPLIFGFDFRDGTVTPLQWTDMPADIAETGGALRWVHLNRLDERARLWAESASGMDPLIVDALFREDTRPRALQHEEGWLINLRGANLNPPPQPDTMIALRIWSTPHLVLSTRAYRIRAAEDLAEQFRKGDPPTSAGALITYLADRLTYRLDQVVQSIGDGVDELEEKVIDGDATILKTDLARLRRQAIAIRRYMAPQREALLTLAADRTGFVDEEGHRALRETLDVLARVTEDLDAVRDRAQLVHDQIAERRGEEMNQRLFVLAIISAVFLPLGFVTGLFGVNVAGMPGVDSAGAFAILSGSLGLLAIGLLLVFRRIGWM